MRIFVAVLFTGILSITLYSNFSTASAESVQNVKMPVVVELFTSQSCSSCPPADRILGQIAKNKNVIALSCHVTYWNHLHWKDTLSKEFCTERQQSYAYALKKRGPYTPQMIINGTHDVVGNRSKQVSNLIEKTSKNEALIPVKITQNANTLYIQLPKATAIIDQASVLLFSYKNKHTQSIPSGENSGRTVLYTNPVDRLTPLGTWNGKEASISYDASNAADGYAVIIQEKNHGRIIGAGKLEL